MTTSNFEPEGPLVDLTKIKLFPAANFDRDQKAKLSQNAERIRVRLEDGTVEEYESGMEGR